MKTKITIAITLICIIQSCAKDNTNLLFNIFFKGTLEESVKSSSYLSSGVQSLLYTFSSNSSDNLTPGIRLFSDGFMGLFASDLVILQRGVYNFYSISLNETCHPTINFDNNNYAIPENGKDYIWACKQGEYLEGKHYIEFSFKHIASKVQLIVEAPCSYSNVSLNYIKYTLSNCSSSSLNLKTGEITAATAVLPLDYLSGTGNNRTFITIPCSAQKQVEVSINATIEGIAANNLIYSSYIDTPFEPGIFYTINFSIQDLINSSISLSFNEWNYNSNIIIY